VENKILITGSRGCVGTAVRKIIKYPYDEIDVVIGTDHKDVRGREGTLIYLSSWSEQDESLRCPAKYIENNLTALSLLLTNNNFDRVIFPSSNSVYDGYGNLEPNSVYGLTKLSGEKLVKMYCKDHYIFRFANIYGPNDRRSVFYILAQCKLQNKIFNLYVKKGMVRDYVHVDSVARVINTILGGWLEPGIYNVGTGRGVEITEILKNICEKFNIDYKVVDLPEYIADGFIPTKRLIKTEERDLEAEWQKYLIN